jgi:DNA repair protein SbcD/Mre11
MRILHTSDWHLGQKLVQQQRDAEQAMALDWLLEVIEREQVEALIVAGDIFDVSNPPVGAEELYYRFLTQLRNTTCKHIVVTGGNHDSPARLNAPRGLLKALNVHVIGALPDDLSELIVPLHDAQGQVAATVVAVPFLRDRDFRYTVAGEGVDSRIEQIQAGIANIYEQVAALLPPERGVVIATGHLYAKGASATDEQQNIYLGNLENISADQFPAAFDYVALGHVHRQQKVGKKDHIRYCGSLIPLSFSERTDKKGVILLETTQSALQNITVIEAPIFRQLLTIKGSLEAVVQQLEQLNTQTHPLPAWVEVILTDTDGLAAPHQYLRDLVATWPLAILKIRTDKPTLALEETLSATDLASLSVDEVFEQRCIAKGLSQAETQRMQQTFAALKQWMNERENTL